MKVNYLMIIIIAMDRLSVEVQYVQVNIVIHAYIIHLLNDQN